MKKLLLFISLISVALSAQITLKITKVPANTPAGTTIFVAGSFNGWNPGSTPLVADGAGNYTYTIPAASGAVEYKFTRGAWSSVEGNASGGQLANRTTTHTAAPQTLELTVLSWEDLGGVNTSTAAANVKILSESFHIPQLNRNRKIWIYLPPDYETSTKRYPVIYMQDGQNLFDNKTAFAGEWQVDETLNKLFSEGDYGAIVIGIENGGSTRIDEYTPWKNAQYGGGEGELYMKFIAETLKPYVDANYRTKSGREFNALMGSSLGALISNYGAVKYSSLFSKTGSFSPAYWIVSSELNNYIASSSPDLSTSRIYFVAGATESKTMADDIERVKDNMQTKGLSAANTFVKLDSYGQHNENYWKGEFPAAYKWLFQTTVLKTAEAVNTKKLSVNFEKNQIFVKGLNGKSAANLYDMSGRIVEKLHLVNGWNPLNKSLEKGSYFLQTDSESIRFIAK